MSICSRLKGQSYFLVRHDHHAGSTSLDQAFQAVSSRCNNSSSPLWKHWTAFSRSPCNSSCVRHVSLHIRKDRLEPPLRRQAERQSLLAQASLTKQSIKISAKRIKWGLLGPELRRTVDTLHQTLSQKSDGTEHGSLQPYDPSCGLGDELTELDSIPLSPLMDPHLQQTKRRHREPKPTPSREKTVFQTKLAKNPYGIFCESLETFSMLILR